MELRSQKLREIAPELDPLRLGTGWKLEDLSKPPSETAIPEADICWSLSKRPAKALQKPAVTAQDISAPISAMEKLRDTTGSTTPCRPEI